MASAREPRRSQKFRNLRNRARARQKRAPREFSPCPAPLSWGTTTRGALGMTDKNERESSAAVKPAEGGRQRPLRLPYRAPVLRYLGSVRSLTLGGTSGTRKDFPKFTVRR